MRRKGKILLLGGALGALGLAVTLSWPASAMTSGQVQSSAPKWMALIEAKVNGSWQLDCSGSVVGDGWVLTAGHCEHTVNTSGYRVVLGSTNANDLSKGTTFAVNQINMMPGEKDGTNDAALLRLTGFNSAQWDALPLAFESSVVNGAGGVTLYGYGDNRWQGDKQVGDGLLRKSPDGSYVEATCPSGPSTGHMICFHRTVSTIAMKGDSGGPWLKWVDGAWQLIGDNVGVFNQQYPDEIQDPAAATSVLDSAYVPLKTVLQWVRQTASLPVEPANTIVRDRGTGTAWLVETDGYRHWIPTGGDYLCFQAKGSPVANMSRLLADTIPDDFGSQAKCSSAPPPPPPPPTTYTEQEGHHGVNTFTNYHNASGMGPRIAPAQYVQVSCKVYDPYIASVNPDGYWYRIASSPWNNQYYSPANTFMNGDPWSGPYTHNTDWNVPNC